MGLLGGVMVVVLAAPGVEQQAGCKKVFDARQAAAGTQQFGVAPTDFCRALQMMLADVVVSASRPRQAATVQVDVTPQPIQEGTLGGVGAGGMAASVPSPGVGLTTALAGTASGARVLAELRLNPVGLIAPGSAGSRLADVVVLLPVSTGTSTLPDYVGVRARFNMLAFSPQLAERIRDAARERFATFNETRDAVGAALETGVTKAECQTALQSFTGTLESEAEVSTKCGVDVLAAQAAALKTAVADFDEEVERLRHDEHTRYLSLDLRADLGDPRLGGAPLSSSTTLTGSLAGGLSVSAIELRARVGFAWVQDSTGAGGAGDFGVGAAWVPTIGTVRGRFSVGVEGRWNDGRGEVASHRFFDFRAGIGVPLADGTSATVSLLVPIDGSGRVATLSIGGNWDLVRKSVLPVALK